MKLENRITRWVFATVYLLLLSTASAASSESKTISLVFRNVEYQHRWSKDGQNEFTPQGQEDLNSWRDMITLNVHESVANGEQLAEVANKVLANYQRAGKILRTDSKSRTPDRPAEHLVVAVLGSRAFLEAAFARFVLVDGVGIVTVYSHRVYGTPAGQAMSEWLQANGPQVEGALMALDKLPTSVALKTLPQSN
ncbi:MAG: hypothetical protein ROZ09_13550 [Thiobacillus sp.]|jgi:hypothetical protein|uniref:hypothetical protein n=1 Tax=Thiobacillus sp. TaxID=924 RepID=UPI0028955B0A|nr:hypothetical protein [Thiobacillus sp.]MDT3707843.1 hypothetical protein [Thiobacillus sp.]